MVLEVQVRVVNSGGFSYHQGVDQAGNQVPALHHLLKFE